MFYQTYRYDDEGHHWRACVYNCDEMTDYGAHVGDPATCEEDEYCSRCNTVVNAALGHSVQILDAVEPTCDTVGYTQGSCCANCGEEVSREVVTTPALGHNYSKELFDQGAPTCTANGWVRYECTCLLCGKTIYETETTPAVGHTDTDPDDHRCDICGAELCTNHTSEVVLGKDATCSAEEKSEAAYEFEYLQRLIGEYNAKAQTANNELAEATEVAFAPIAATSFAFPAALWFILRKKFLV